MIASPWFTTEDSESAVQKLSIAALHFNQMGPSDGVLTKPFEKFLNAAEFKSLLKKIFNVILTKNEVKSYFKYGDFASRFVDILNFFLCFDFNLLVDFSID